MRRPASRKSRAFVLLVALGVLGVLGLLAATFATLSRVERAVSNSYVDKVRAKMLAQSGVERAIASIRGRAMIQAWDDTRNDWYYREMLNAAAGGLNYAPAALALWQPYVPSRPYGAPPRSLGATLDDGMLNGKPGGVSFPDFAAPAVSGRLPGTYEPDGDVYALKVLDCASMLNVNDGHAQIVRLLNNLGAILRCADGTPVSAGGFQLGTQLQTRAVARGKPFNNKQEVLADAFLANPFFAGNDADARKRFDAVRDFITCHGWVDGMTTRFDKTWTGAGDYVGGSYAVASSGTSGGSGTGGGGTGTGGGTGGGKEPGTGGGVEPGGGDPEPVGGGKEPPPDGGGETDPDAGFKADPGVPGFAYAPQYTLAPQLPGIYASLPRTTILPAPGAPAVKDLKRGGGFRQYVTGQGTNPALGGETGAGKFGGTYYYGEPRTPVNVNTCTREVLVATLMDLEADFWDYETVSEAAASKQYTSRMVLRNVKVTQAQAEAAADFIISARFTHGTPAGAWSFNDWMHFEDEVLHALPGLDRFQRALIRANANPNTNVRKLNPDLILVASNPAVRPDELVRLDKSDIKIASTEWTFASNGFYEIECVGRVYASGRIMAEERIETVVKLYDVARWTTQEQFEQDRVWSVENSAEGDLLAGGYPPVVSMPEYAYNAAPNPVRYRSATGDVAWAADYDGYLVLNGPARVVAGMSPGPASSTLACNGSACKVSFVAGFNAGSLYPQQSHRAAWHDAPGGFGAGGGGPRHPEYAYTTPHCFGDGGTMYGAPLNSFVQDSGYKSGNSYTTKKPFQIQPDASGNGGYWYGGGGGGAGNGANFWDNGCDLQNFGVYCNGLRRNRFLTYWADEVPAPDATIEMTVKPEIDLWSWAPASRLKTMSGSWGGGYQVGPCSRLYLFDWGVGGTYGMNYTVRCYVQLSRVFLEIHHKPTNQFFVIYADHQWKPHTWHHVEVSWEGQKTLMLGAPPAPVAVPANATLFVDGVPASAVLSGTDVNAFLGRTVLPVKAVRLPEDVRGTTPNNNVGTGPRFCVGSKLQNDGMYGMTQPSWIGTIDNVVMHHWRSHDAAFTPRNRYHSVSYYDGSAVKSGTGMKGEKAGVYKKRLAWVEQQAQQRPVTIGTLSCTHYHPFHVHLYGHDGAAPTTSFGHITPTLRVKTGGSYVDNYYYDGCAGLPVKMAVTPGSEVLYLGWFEVASLVPVTMSPILCDITLTTFSEPVTYYRMSSAEARR